MTTATTISAIDISANSPAMLEVHARLTAAVRRAVEKFGETEREAFGEEMRYLAAKFPNVFRAYSAWLVAVNKG